MQLAWRYAGGNLSFSSDDGDDHGDRDGGGRGDHDDRDDDDHGGRGDGHGGRDDGDHGDRDDGDHHDGDDALLLTPHWLTKNENYFSVLEEEEEEEENHFCRMRASESFQSLRSGNDDDQPSRQRRCGRSLEKVCDFRRS
ncbi:hypothetical protein CEXT_737891 [Caerostris extrusa]|uniref:Uncharacterized protein n=1 Tax=Caerostris extrusa TaxID=172846 RepID=A0AAV4Y174_CAEEX|nr:hypothetical protein CEXT_737891 [Caerostris extrusa]